MPFCPRGIGFGQQQTKTITLASPLDADIWLSDSSIRLLECASNASHDASYKSPRSLALCHQRWTGTKLPRTRLYAKTSPVPWFCTGCHSLSFRPREGTVGCCNIDRQWLLVHGNCCNMSGTQYSRIRMALKIAFVDGSGDWMDT